MKKKFSKILGVGLTIALLCSLLLTAAPVSALSSASVVLTHATPALADDISQAGVTYTVTLTIGTQLAEGANITLVAPTGTSFATTVGNVANVKMSATSGLGSTAFSNVNVAGFAGTTTNTLVVQVGDVDGGASTFGIGAGALVQLVILVVQNGPTPSTINVLNISTAAEATAVASQAFTLAAPYVPPVAGVVSGLNASNILLTQQTGGNAIGVVANTAGIAKVEVGEGTYDANALTTIPPGITVIATAGPSVTLIDDADSGGTGGNVAISGGAAGAAVLDGFTITGGVNVTAVGGTAGLGVTIQNCILAGAAIDLDIDAGTATVVVLSSGNIITPTTGAVGIDVANGIIATSTGDTITLTDATGTGVVVNGTGTLTMTGGSITGASGIGIDLLAGGTLTLTGAELSGLDQAIRIGSGAGGATATITGNTITNCGDAVNLLPAINILAAPAALGVNISGNTIADCPDEILRLGAVATIAANVFMNFNTITNPAKGIVNADTGAVVVDATNNYWGVSTGPAVTSTLAKTTPFLRGDTTGGTIYPGAVTLTNTTVGVIVADSAAAAWTNAGVALYDANPGTVAPPGEVLKYIDVYVNVPTNNIIITVLGIQSSAAQVYAWSATQGLWVLASNQVIDMFQGGVVVTVSAATSPTLANLAALEFALVEPTPVAPTLAAPTIISPEGGERDVPLTPAFSWTQILAADAYYFELADNANFVVPLMKLAGDVGRLIVTAYAYVPGLDYSTAYYWRVKAVSGTIEAGDSVESVWVSAVFITMDEPVEVEVLPPVEIVEAPTLPDIIIEQPEIVVPLPAETPITPAWIYVIIGVGAVLVIALLVLIVRTRRVA